MLICADCIHMSSTHAEMRFRMQNKMINLKVPLYMFTALQRFATKWLSSSNQMYKSERQTFIQDFKTAYGSYITTKASKFGLCFGTLCCYV